jgi:hypothetical protein
MSLKPKSTWDNPWVDANDVLIPTKATGFVFYLYFEKCDISIPIGELEFCWIIEAQMP